MMRRIVDFRWDDYTQFDNIVTYPTDLTERQTQLIQAALQIMQIRNAWDNPTDSQWNDIEAELAAV